MEHLNCELKLRIVLKRSWNSTFKPILKKHDYKFFNSTTFEINVKKKLREQK
jgi:hypothetical protein